MFKNFDIPALIKRLQDDAKQLSIKPNDSYLKSYPEFIRYFKDIDNINQHHLTIGVHFTYGWMPTIFEFQSGEFDVAIDILNRAKKGTIPSIEELQILKKLLNNSMVGTSKLLHFINPDKFAIWDSRVFRYLTGMEPYQNRIGNCQRYLEYLTLCQDLIAQPGFSILRERMKDHAMTDLRAVEFIMFMNGGAKGQVDQEDGG